MLSGHLAHGVCWQVPPKRRAPVTRVADDRLGELLSISR